MFSLAWSTIKVRRGGFAAAFIALFFGAMVITACGILLESGLRSGVPAERYAAASVVVGGKQTMEKAEDIDPYYAERVPLAAGATERIARVPGVEKAVPERTFALDVVNRDGKIVPADIPVYGHGWSSAALAPFTLSAGREPAQSGETVLDAGLAARAGLSIGDTARLAIGSAPAGYRVVGLTTSSVHRQSAVFFTDDQAAQLTGRPAQLTAVGVLAAPGTDADQLAARIQAALPDLLVSTYTGHDLGDVEFLDVGQARGFLVALATAFMGTVTMIVLFVVASTLSLSIQQRRRELAMLRAIAASPRQIHQMIGAEVLLVAVAGGLLGSLPGYATAGWLRDGFASAGVLPADFDLTYSVFPALAALLLCVLGGRLAGYFAARRIAKINPVEALGESAVEPPALGAPRVLSGVALLVLGLAAAVVLPLVIPGPAAVAGAGSSVLLLMIGTALLGPKLVRAATTFAAPVLNRFRISGYLAVANARANSRRLSGAVVPLALGLAMAAVQIFTITTVDAAAAEQAKTGVIADYVLQGSASGLSPEVADAVRQVPGVDVVTPVARSQVMLKFTESGKPQADSYAAQGLAPEKLDRTLDLAVRSGSLADLHGDTVALSPTTAGQAGVEVGDTVGVNLGDGTEKQLKVVAIYGNGLGFGDLTLPHDLLVEHTTNRLDSSILVAGTPSPALLAALASAHPGLSVLDRSAFSAAQQSQRDQQSTTNLIVNGLLLAYLVIAVVNTLVMATGARVREFAMLRLIGTSRRNVRRMMAMEAGIVVGAAMVIGTAVAIPPLIGISLAMTEQPLPSVSPVVYGYILGVTVVIGFGAIVSATRSALRGRPIDAVGSGG